MDESQNNFVESNEPNRIPSKGLKLDYILQKIHELKDIAKKTLQNEACKEKKTGGKKVPVTYGTTSSRLHMCN